MQQASLQRALGERYVVGISGDMPSEVVKSAGRVLHILELFDILKREALVSEVSELLGFPQSSTSVLLRSMVALGYLSYNRDTRAYAPTTKVALLGSWINGPLVNDGALMQLMQRLSARTEQAIVLAVRHQTFSHYIHVVQATSLARLYVLKGSKRPLIASSSGLAFLAELPDAEIKRIAVRTNSETQTGEIVSVVALMQQVEEVRRNGYAFTCEMVTAGGGMLAIRLPRRAASGEQFVIGIGGVSEVLRARKDELLAAMHEEIAAYLLAEKSGRSGH